MGINGGTVVFKDGEITINDFTVSGEAFYKTQDFYRLIGFWIYDRYAEKLKKFGLSLKLSKRKITKKDLTR